MLFFKKGVYFVAVIAIILSLCTNNVEGRRKILRGRKTVTRTYFRENALPAYAFVILVAIGEIIVGGVMYVVLRKTILDLPITGSYVVTNTSEA
ncbi:unnamed protein product [Callosobruchus maculatus]|uniref:Uncharacterized protein n=1 Tax=Callosobruchus maculatus TaxID=64391 RepID=A0A653BFM1_CALMS|nr:unnamed protein product [Callosobruchus maculatus]